jgi:hypothetical protein
MEQGWLSQWAGWGVVVEGLRGLCKAEFRMHDANVKAAAVQFKSTHTLMTSGVWMLTRACKSGARIKRGRQKQRGGGEGIPWP